MKLRGIDFGNVLGASGMQGFFGEGYWFHKIWSRFGLDLKDVTFVAKTATLLPCRGNMTLTRHYAPRNPFPGCVKARLLRGVMLNAVGLSNPGLGALLVTGKLQERIRPFLLSVMPVADTPQKRLEELRLMVEMIDFVKNDFSAPFGLQINLSCPNVKHNLLVGESAKMLSIAGRLGVPIMPKYSIASVTAEDIRELNEHPDCDAICVSNTLPFGWEGINWKHVWGSVASPLVRLGGGGLSGKALRPLVCEWIACLRNMGFTKPINGGGGILCLEDVEHYRNAGASSIFLGSVTVLRPWRVKAIVAKANTLEWNEKKR